MTKTKNEIEFIRDITTFFKYNSKLQTSNSKLIIQYSTFNIHHSSFIIPHVHPHAPPVSGDQEAIP